MIIPTESEVCGTGCLEASPSHIIYGLASFHAQFTDSATGSESAVRILGTIDWGIVVRCPPRSLVKVDLFKPNHPALEPTTYFTPNICDVKPVKNVVVVWKLGRTEFIALSYKNSAPKSIEVTTK